MRFSVTHVPGLSFLPLILTVLWAPGALAANEDLRLVDAVKNQDTPTVRALLKQQVDVDARQPDGATALLWAAQWDDVETAEVLIRAGADVNAANDFGVTPLSMAATNGSAAMLRKLLEARANPDAALPSGETALMTAAFTGKLEAVNVLLTRGVNVNAREGSRGQTALMWALSERHRDVVRRLIESGADVNAASHSGFTPLMFAARQGDLEAAKLLLVHGAGVNATAADGASVLHVATVRGHAELAAFLLEQGANPNANGPGYTPLHWAAGTWESLTAHAYKSGELSAIAGLPTRDGKLGLIRALLAHGANVNAPIKKSPPRFGSSFANVRGGGSFVGATPFFFAAMVGDVEVMRMLVANGADPVLATTDHTTPLMVAVGIATSEAETDVPERSRLDAVKLCLELGADINAANRAGNTALHGTAFFGLVDTIVRFLVDNGASLNAKNKKSETPLKIAEGHDQIMQLVIHEKTADLLRSLGGVSQ